MSHPHLLLRAIFLGGVLFCNASHVFGSSLRSQLVPKLHVQGVDIATDSWLSPVDSDICPQVDAVHPAKHFDLNANLNELYLSESFKLRAIEALSGAIRVPTESYDGMDPVGQDPRWEVFGQLHRYFENTYPLLYSKLEVTKVNTYGLVFHWQGSNDTLLPILLAGHQDVVPVEPITVDQWKYPPYSGYYDGTWIWGRGSCDDKSSVINILNTVDSLLHAGFEPSRTIVLAFGFDEESSGNEGAGHLAEYLEATYGKNGFAVLLDEGGGFDTPFGEEVVFAVPCTAEKGYLDALIEISTPGGHSSVPPKHTSIGILSSAIVEIESNPHVPSLLRTGTPFSTITCAAAYGPSIPSLFRELAKKAVYSDSALEKLKELVLASDPLYGAMLGTTQAADVVKGGVKVNALPEKASVIVNHRIAEHSSVLELQEHLTELLLPIANKFNLTFSAFGTNITTTAINAAGHIEVKDAFGSSLEPAPITPTTGSSGPYELLAGTIKGTFENSTIYKASSVVVSPLLAMGNTDTRFYWNLTKHIFRYGHISTQDAYNGAHTVNEAIRATAIIEEVRFLTRFILNWDESSI